MSHLLDREVASVCDKETDSSDEVIKNVTFVVCDKETDEEDKKCHIC